MEASHEINWNGKIVILMKFSSLDALEVVVVTNDDPKTKRCKDNQPNPTYVWGQKYPQEVSKHKNTSPCYIHRVVIGNVQGV